MKYKITYHNGLMATMFVRVADDAILYVNENEMYVRLFAEGFCLAKGEKFFIE